MEKILISFNIKNSFVLQVEVIVVDDPDVTLLLGMQEAVKAELVFHAQSGRIMRMIQPHRANIHIYQATTIFTMPRPSGPKTRGPSIKMAPDNRTYGSDPSGRQQREYFEVQLARFNAYIMVTFGLSGQRAQPK